MVDDDDDFLAELKSSVLSRLSDDVDVASLLAKTLWAVRLLGADALVTSRDERVVVIVPDEIDWGALVQVLSSACM